MAICSVLLDFGYGNSIRFPAKTVGVTPFESFTDGTMKVLDVQRQIPLTNPASSEPFIQGLVYRFTEPNGDTLFKTIPALTTAVYADIVEMFPVPSDSPLLIDAIVRWAPNTIYTAGQQVVSPNNDVVSALAGFTSGASYVAANWVLSSTFVPDIHFFTASGTWTKPTGAVTCHVTAIPPGAGGND